MIRLSVLLLLLLLSPQQTLSASFQKGDVAYLCFKHNLHPNWPEVFAYQVEILKGNEKSYKVMVVKAFPMGKINEEQEPVKGDMMKISKAKVYGKHEAGIIPGSRFNGKPVCHNLM